MNRKDLILFISVCFFSFEVLAQNALPVKYFANNWKESSTDSAFYSIEHVKVAEGYRKTIYLVKANKIYETSIITDTGSLGRRIGTAISYFENGNISDSTKYGKPGRRSEVWRYYHNGQLNVHCTFDTSGSVNTTEAFDSTGSSMSDYIYEREAEFPGGQKAWVKYLTKSVKTDFYKRDFKTVAEWRRRSEMTFMVQVQFVIDKDGSVSEAKIRKSSGNDAVDADAVKVIKNCPKWNNAIQYNSPVNAYRLQPITYLIQ